MSRELATHVVPDVPKGIRNCAYSPFSERLHVVVGQIRRCRTLSFLLGVPLISGRHINSLVLVCDEDAKAWRLQRHNCAFHWRGSMQHTPKSH
jgi:hypothetical protein